jgi:MarR family 2-MHQ and catechol resistance regulon transcriptional repressor
MGTHYQGTKQQTLALDLYIKLLRSADSVSSRLQPFIDAAGLTVSQFGVLEAVHHLGPLHLSVLAQKLLKSGGNLTLVVRNLEKRGLVNRKQGTSDRRYFTVHLTAKGERVIRKVFSQHLKNLVKVVGVLQPAEQQELARLCKKLGRGVESAIE